MDIDINPGDRYIAILEASPSYNEKEWAAIQLHQKHSNDIHIGDPSFTIILQNIIDEYLNLDIIEDMEYRNGMFFHLFSIVENKIITTDTSEENEQIDSFLPKLIMISEKLIPRRKIDWNIRLIGLQILSLSESDSAVNILLNLFEKHYIDDMRYELADMTDTLIKLLKKPNLEKHFPKVRTLRNRISENNPGDIRLTYLEKIIETIYNG